MNPNSPAAVYADRLAARQATAAQLRARLDQLSYARLGAFLVGLVVAGLAFGANIFSAWWALLPVAAFFFLVVKFEMARGRLGWAERAGRFYAGGIDRLAGKPGGLGDGARFADDAHPYAADLDLFGPGSLFERLTACRTRSGEDTLAAWLKAPAGPEEVAARQAAVTDLKPRLDLRESLAVAGAEIPGGADYARLVAWGTGQEPNPPAPFPGKEGGESNSPLSPRGRGWGVGSKPSTAWKRWAIEVLGWGNVLAWVGWLVAGTTSLPVLLFGIATLIVAMPLLAWAGKVLAPVEKAETDLSLLEVILARLEREPFTSPRLRELQAAMKADGRTASAQIRELRDLVAWYNSRRNPLFIPVAVLRVWNVRYAFKLEAWRARSGPAVGRWVRAVGEAEALASLAGYAFENPADVFPEVLAGALSSSPPPLWGRSAEGRVGGEAEVPPHPNPPPPGGREQDVFFSALALGHPLLPADRCVRNDVRLGGDGLRVLVVSGSNMSGKSTLLRAVGVNAVLALAGGVVRAERLSLTRIALGATMRVQDSLAAGRSRFFAEVTKVRTLLDVAKANDPPLLFLLDELFAGTNSADRVAGAEGVIRTLLEAGAVGLVTTHDLALTAVTDRLPGAVNVHFCDGFAGGELHFDYRMRPGVVPHGNGLALMRAVGLGV